MQYKKYFFIILFIFVALLQPTFAEKSEIDLKVSDLESRYVEVETALKDLQGETDRLENIGYGGPVLRKDLKILAENIVHLKKELTGLENELDQLDEGRLLKLPEFEISATINTQDELPKGGQVSSGDKLMFHVKVKFPEQKEPAITELIWQMFDPEGNEKTKLQKRIQLFESGKELPQEYGPITINAKNLKNGEYKVALTHRLVEKPETYFQDVFPFKLFQAVRIKKLVVTANPEDQDGRNILYSDERPYFYVYYELAESVAGVDVMMNVRSRKTGEAILNQSTYRERKEGKIQRVGFALKKGAIKTGTSADFEVTLTPADGKNVVAIASFSVSDYTLTLDIPGTLTSGKSRDFKIRVPELFAPPYKVDIESARGLSIGHYKGKLNGTVTGIAKESNVYAKFNVTVTDAKGRKGDVSASVHVEPEPEPEIYASTTNTLSSESEKGSKSFWDFANYLYQIQDEIQDCQAKAGFLWTTGGTGEKGYFVDFHVGQFEKKGYQPASIFVKSIDGYDYPVDDDDLKLVRQFGDDISNREVKAYYTTNSLSDAIAFAKFLCGNPGWVLRDHGLTYNNPAVLWPLSDHYTAIRPIPPRPWQNL